MSTVQRGRMASDGYGTVSNAFARDARLSFKARGLGLWLFSQTQGWQTSIRAIAAQNGCGTESVMTGLQELERYGYLQRKPQVNTGGRFGDVDYIVTDVPPVSGKPEHGNRVRVSRVRENRVRETGTHKKTNFQEDQGQEDQGKTSSPGGDGALTGLALEFARDVETVIQDEHAHLTPVGVRAANERVLDAEFAGTFWPEYPRKIGKQAALVAYRRARRGGVTVDDVMAGLRRFVKEKADTEARFIPHASTWLNAGRWADEPESTTTRNGHQPYRDDPSDWDYDDANPLEHR